MTFASANHLALYADHALDRLAQSHSYLAESGVDPYIADEIMHYHRRSPARISRMQDPLDGCQRNLGWSIDWAVAFIVDHLQTSEAANDLRNIRMRAASLEHEGLSQEIPYCIFHKLADILFAGHLKNAVYLDIRSLNSTVSGATYTQSWVLNTGVKCISINLNSNVLQYAGAKEIIAVMIHHMIHAYFLVACGPQKEEEVAYGRLDHGVHFGKVLSAIKKVSAAHGKELTSLKCGHNLLKMNYHADERHDPKRKAAIERQDKDEWYCSHCHHHVQETPDSDIDKWYNSVCAPMFEQPKSVRLKDVAVYNSRHHELETKCRGRLPPSAKSVEFIFKAKPVLVETSKINNLPSVKEAFEKTKSRYIKIHKDVSESTFLRLLEFLHVGSYHPDPRPFTAAAAALGITKKAPPMIKPQNTTTDAYLLMDVQFAKLGTLMGFTECKEYALGRMNSYGVIHEDPITIIKEIYSGTEPDPDLKAWTRKFLVRAAAPYPTYYSTSNILHTADPPNLMKLESEQSSYRARFLDTIDANGALENDVNKARAELEALGWYTWAGLSAPNLLTYAPKSHTSSPLPLSFPRSPPALLPNTNSLSPPALPSSLSSSLASLSITDLNHLRNLERVTQLQNARELDRLRGTDAAKQLERERARLRALGERAGRLDARWETDVAREERLRAESTAALEALYERGAGGFVFGTEDY